LYRFAFSKPLLGQLDIFDGAHECQAIVAAEPGITMGHEQLAVTPDRQRQQSAGKMGL
jgi:hypothetical protein